MSGDAARAPDPEFPNLDPLVVEGYRNAPVLRGRLPRMPTFDPALTVRIPVAWGEMDAFQHVNNTVYLRWFETARIEWLAKVAFTENGGAGPILARTEIDYRLPVVWPDTVEVAVGVVTMGRSSVTLGYRITSASHAGAVVAEGVTVVVLFDYAAKKAIPIDDALRARIAAPSA